MQRLALLSGANPRVCKDGPVVRLSSGKWRIDFEGVRESVLWIQLTSKPFERQDEDQVVPLPITDGHEVTLHIPSNARVIFQHRGSEPFISVMAQKVA